MRIISGKYRRRRLHTPPDAKTTRPIPDRVKEALFNLLRGNVEGAAVLDAFAGTGSIGLEAVSRGAASCVFVERDRRMAGILRQNIEELGCGDRCRVINTDALGASLAARLDERLDLIFFDPPYPLISDEAGLGRVKRQLSRLAGLLSEDGFVALRTPWPFRHGPTHEQHDADLSLPPLAGPETHAYGSTAIHLYARHVEDEHTPQEPDRGRSVQSPP